MPFPSWGSAPWDIQKLLTIKDLNHEWATYLLENLFFMDANTIRVENFYVFFPQNFTH